MKLETLKRDQCGVRVVLQCVRIQPIAFLFD